jgi:DNA-binding MarR family transcriptional regulator
LSNELYQVAVPAPPPRYRDNLARHLIGISRDLQTRVREELAARGHRGLRPSFGPLLSLVWDEGRSLSALASELAISSQATSQLVNLAEDARYLERRPNPADRRSRLVVLTRQGRALVVDGVRVILASEAAYSALVGPAPYRRFTAALAALYGSLGLPNHPDPTLMARASRTVGVLPLIALRIERELMRATAAHGHAGLQMSFGQVLPLIRPEGSRIHEIARVQRLSRQAISAISQEIEALGYLARRPDARDRRGVVLTLTRAGEALIRDSVAALDELERGFHDVLGGPALEQLRRVARDLYQALHLEAEVFESRRTAREPMGHDVRRLATRLRRSLGRGDAARLAALLGPRTGRIPT